MPRVSYTIDMDEKLPYSGRKVSEAKVKVHTKPTPKPAKRKLSTNEEEQTPSWARRLVGVDWDRYITAVNNLNKGKRNTTMPRERSFDVLERDTLREHRQVMVKIGDYEAGDEKIGTAGDDGKIINVGDPKTQKADYWVPSDAKKFQEFVLGLSDKTLDDAYAKYVSAVDASARASVRESVTADTTIIMVNGAKVDVMDYPVSKLIKAINSFAGVAASTGKEMPNAFATAKRRLIEKGTATEVEDPSGDGSMVLSLVK